jgi:hypothetical protein
MKGLRLCLWPENGGLVCDPIFEELLLMAILSVTEGTGSSIHWRGFLKG